MALQSQKEQTLTYEWAKCHTGNNDFFTTANRSEQESFFSSFDQTDNMMPYDFHTIAELRKKLGEMWKNDDIMQGMPMICALAAYKEAPMQRKKDDKKVNNTEVISPLPDSVYVF